MNIKQTIQKLLPLAKYFIFLHIGLFGFPYLYVDALHCYVEKFYVIIVFFLLSGALDYYVSNNRYLKRSGWAKSISSVLIIELFCLFLFAQYHFVLSILLAIILIAFSVWSYRTIYASRPERQRFRKYRILCRQKALSVICYVSVVLLIIPACVGLYQEDTNSISLEDWMLFVELFNESADHNSEQTIFDKYHSTMDELKNWEQLSRKDRLELLSKIGLMEEEYLGIETEIPIVISSKKMDKYTCAYYEDDTKEIRINIDQIDNEDLETNIKNILHEVFHAYQHNVVDHLDFETSVVQNSYYYMDARAWHDNMNNYISGYLDFNAYESQPLEADARAYSEKRVEDYLLCLQK